jgi:hypothetical protein
MHGHARRRNERLQYLSIGIDLHALLLYSVHKISGVITNEVVVLLWEC